MIELRLAHISCQNQMPIKAIYNVRPGLSGIGSTVFREEERLLSKSDLSIAEFSAKHIALAKGGLALWYQHRVSFRTDVMHIFLAAWVIVSPKSWLSHKVFKDLPAIQVLGLDWK